MLFVRHDSHSCHAQQPPQAVSRYNCQYLYHLLQSQYRVYGGDPAWLEGVLRETRHPHVLCRAPLRVRSKAATVPSWRQNQHPVTSGPTSSIFASCAHFSRYCSPRTSPGIKRAPVRLQNLQELNCTLAHQPWLMKQTMIRALVRGVDSWSMSELAQVAVILVTYHSLCGMLCAVVLAQRVNGRELGKATLISCAVPSPVSLADCPLPLQASCLGLG